MAQQTSVSVQFSAASLDENGNPPVNAFISAEVDNREDGLNNGETSFAPGDTAWILVYTSANVRVQSVVASAGSVIQGEAVNVEQSQDVIFMDATEARLSNPVKSVTSTGWMGASLGSLTLSDDGQTITAENKGVGVARINYVAEAASYGIASPPSMDFNGEPVFNFTIAVLVTGEVI
jgi:hypothetical protein